MSREQIEEMSIEIQEAVKGCSSYWSGLIAERLYEQGYRKKSVGEWVRDNEYKPYICSNCRRFMTFQNLNFCPECGARMEGGAEE